MGAAMLALAAVAGAAAAAFAARAAIAWLRHFPLRDGLQFAFWRFAYLGGQSPLSDLSSRFAAPLVFALALIPIEILKDLVPRQRRPRRALWAAALAGAGLVTVYAWELGVEEAWRVPFSYTPHAVQVDCRSGRCVAAKNNGLGFRGPELATPRPANAKRVLLLGDSYVYGSGVADDETLDAALSRRLGAGWEVGNFGIPGFNLTAYARMAEAVVARYSPDVVVVGYLDGVNNILASDYWEIRDGLGSLLWGFARLMGMTGEIFVVHARDDYKDEAASRAASSSKDAAALRRLLALQRSRRLRLVFFSYFGPLELTKAAEKGGRLTLLSPKQPWQADPSLAFSAHRDGHPTGKANELFAEQIARELVKR